MREGSWLSESRQSSGKQARLAGFQSNLDLRLAEYSREGRTPVFVSERVPAENREEWMGGLYRESAERASALGGAEAFLAHADTPERFKKVRAAYEAERTKVEADRRIIGLMREKTLDAIESDGPTVYRLCKDLDLNQGNVYAYLGIGDASKASRATARRLMEHAQSLQGRTQGFA